MKMLPMRFYRQRPRILILLMAACMLAYVLIRLFTKVPV